MSELLNSFVSYIDDEIAKEDRTIHVLPYANIKRAKETWFIRVMGFWFDQWFGQYHYGKLAILTEAALGLDHVDAAFVRSKLREWEYTRLEKRDSHQEG